MNGLAAETSPYLLQHKNNPVDWQVWGPETLDKARAEDKPILLSVGYAACHWCHVMAAESFEDADTAALMNKLFVPVKVDREERPDIDAIYQSALALMGQHGGWPLTMFLTPQGEPFWGGTYYPPTAKFGRPAFRDVLQRVAAVYRSQKDTLEKNTKALREGLRSLSASSEGEAVTPDMLNALCDSVAGLIDPVEGGLGQAPKFPSSPALAMLWRGYKRTGRAKYGEGVLLTLDRMSQGGIYDHLGGGYARYATDNSWLVPHFEKMLYDNAQLIELLTWAFQDTKSALYAARVEETIGWMLREMRVEGGAFAAAFDADSEHEEGKFYVWTAAEIEPLLGAEAALFKAHYDVHRIGNWEGKTILNRSDKPVLADAETEARLAACRTILLDARERRVRPGRDHKVLADWNGLAIAALVLAASVFGRKAWLAAAGDAFAFISARMTHEDGGLAHSWCEGRVHPGTLDDYAAMSRAALALYQATGNAGYLAWAETWSALLEARFADAEHGGYYMTPAGAPDLIVRLRNAQDHATPSGNGMMVEVLSTLFHLTGNARYAALAERLIGAFAADALRNPVQHAAFLSGMDMHMNAVQLVLFSGEGMQAMLETMNGQSIPNRILSMLDPGVILPAGHPAAGKTRLGEAATAYVCVGQTCSLPLTEPGIFAATLSAALRGIAYPPR